MGPGSVGQGGSWVSKSVIGQGGSWVGVDQGGSWVSHRSGRVSHGSVGQSYGPWVRVGHGSV